MQSPSLQLNRTSMTNDRRILFVLTNTDRIGPNERATGYEFSEVAHPYLVFRSNGFEVDFGSPAGGRPPEEGFDPSDAASTIFRASNGFARLNESLSLEHLDISNYAGLFFPGGLGPMVDLAKDPRIARSIAEAYRRDLVIGAVCHGPVALLPVVLASGERLVSGRAVTSFTAAEERGHSDADVPFFLDDALRAAGAKHSSAGPFERHVVVDGRLVTGQNPASAAGVAEVMLSRLRAG